MKELIIVLIVLSSLKFLSLLIISILKIVYKFKAGDDIDLELSFIKKTTYLSFDTEYDEWYLIPNISISFNGGIDICFKWLKLNYSSFWTCVTYKDEDDYAEFIINKNNEK